MPLIKLVKKIFRLLPIRLACRLQALRVGGKLALGKGSFIHGSVHILGKSHVEMGSNSCISEGCWLNVNHRMGPKPAIRIGNNCFIGKDNFFTSGSSISICDYVLTTLGCKFIGASHIIDDPYKPYASAGTTNDCAIVIGVNCFLGTNAMVLGNVKVGHGSVVGAGAQVMQDVPPFSLVIGNPGTVIKRYSFLKNSWLPTSEISEEDLSVMPDETQYLETINRQFSGMPMPWIAAGRNMGNL